jgi:hypothetical protein
MTYCARTDGIESFTLALRWLSIRHGHRRPQRPLEVYWAESAGVIP